MSINSIRPLSGDLRSPQSRRLSGESVGDFSKSIKEAMRRSGTDGSVIVPEGVPDPRTPDFAERVLESVPAFAALVAKRVVDETVRRSSPEEVRARNLRRLVEEYVIRTQVVSMVRRF
ncbi:MAG: hypothetical protein PHR36_05350 [Patescibacteria group bacterium]|nr:hypothetical protein [Patescibacteria group bacterium]